MADQFDVVIIGGGPGGYNAAIRAGQLGLKTAIVEMRETLGGTCLNVGCIPSKALLHTSEAYEAAAKDFAGLGIKVKGLSLDLPVMMAGKDEAVAGLTKGVAFLMKKNKVEWVSGRGRIDGPGRVAVTAADGSQRVLEAGNILIATGSEPTPLPGVAFDETRIVSSTGALALAGVPKRLVVIGAGVIGLELGSVWRRLGSEVVVVEYLDRILPGMDSEVASQFRRILAKQGMTIETGTKVTGVERTDKGVIVRVEPAAGGGEARALEADIVLVAIGRRPYTEGLGLESVGLATDARGFLDNDHLRARAPGLWVIGDVTHGPMLAHKAEEEGAAVAEAIAGLPSHVDLNLVPGVVYTKPEVASVGRTEDDLKAAGVPVRVGKFPFSANSRARANHDTDGFVKIIEHAETRRILGVHMIGTGAGELIAEAALAMAFSASAEDIARTCHAHPTLSEAVRQAAMAVDGWAMQM